MTEMAVLYISCRHYQVFRFTQEFYTRIYTTLLSILDENIKDDK